MKFTEIKNKCSKNALTHKCSHDIIAPQGTKINRERRAVAMRETRDDDPVDLFETSSDCQIFAYCDHCGFAIDSAEEALLIKGSRDIIHADCWEEYAEDHMFDFAIRASEDGRLGHEL